VIAEKLSSVVPVDDLPAAVSWWRGVLGVDATFVDGDRWAQFDLGGTRLALAGTDRSDDRAGILVKVDDVEASRAELVGRGIAVGHIERGPHELRCALEGPGGVAVTLYSPAG
jgi:catechol 2,3-dioxygenase-like lactoylglutathione lyase family enzyme